MDILLRNINCHNGFDSSAFSFQDGIYTLDIQDINSISKMQHRASIMDYVLMTPNGEDLFLYLRKVSSPETRVNICAPTTIGC